MNITIVTEEPQDHLAFVRAEWKFADLEYYGRKINWKPIKMYLDAYEGEQKIGNLELILQGGVMHIEDVIVHHDWKRKGIGKALMEKAEELAREQKAHKIFLETGRTWPTHEFYLKLGYVKTGELPNHFIGQDYVQYSKFLD